MPDTKGNLPLAVCPFWDSRSELAVLDGVVYKGMRLDIPPSMQQSMLKLIHKSHLGIVKCKQRARKVLYWPGMNADIEQTVKNCGKCADFQKSLPPELASKAPPDLPF